MIYDTEQSNFEQEVLRQILQWRAPGFLKCLDLISSFIMLKAKLPPRPLRYVAPYFLELHCQNQIGLKT